MTICRWKVYAYARVRGKFTVHLHIRGRCLVVPVHFVKTFARALLVLIWVSTQQFHIIFSSLTILCVYFIDENALNDHATWLALRLAVCRTYIMCDSWLHSFQYQHVFVRSSILSFASSHSSFTLRYLRWPCFWIHIETNVTFRLLPVWHILIYGNMPDEASWILLILWYPLSYSTRILRCCHLIEKCESVRQRYRNWPAINIYISPLAVFK